MGGLRCRALILFFRPCQMEFPSDGRVGSIRKSLAARSLRGLDLADHSDQLVSRSPQAHQQTRSDLRNADACERIDLPRASPRRVHWQGHGRRPTAATVPPLIRESEHDLDARTGRSAPRFGGIRCIGSELLLLSTERYRSSDVARANLDTTCQQFANNECSYRMRRMNEGKTAATDEMHPMRGLRLGLRRASRSPLAR